MVSAVWMWCVWSLLAVAAAGERLPDTAHNQLSGERQRDGAMRLRMRMHGRAPVNVSQLDPCSYINNPADLYICRTAGVVEFKDCSKMDQNTIIAAPYLTTVTAFRLKCNALALYLPRLATVTGRIAGGVYSIDLQAYVQYVYLFSLNSAVGFINVGVHPPPEIFEAPFLQHTNGVLSPNAWYSRNRSVSLTAALNDNGLCGADKTLTSAQIEALKQSCALGNVHWDSADGVDPAKFSNAAFNCAASSIQSASFSNVKRTDRIPALDCQHLDYIGDQTIANPGPVLTFKNSVLQMFQSPLTGIYGGIYMVASSIILGMQAVATLHGVRSYLTQPDSRWIIPVPDPNNNYRQMVRCRLATAGQFVPFSDGTLADCGLY